MSSSVNHVSTIHSPSLFNWMLVIFCEKKLLKSSERSFYDFAAHSLKNANNVVETKFIILKFCTAYLKNVDYRTQRDNLN